MEIRTVTVELLRPGPRHNQLISPTTQYLGVCGNFPAGRVTLPYEHGDLERRLSDLRYQTMVEGDPLASAKALERIGREIAGILSGIPGVVGALDPETERPGTLTHLRLVLSASELALIPFEATKVPTGEAGAAMWLALKVRAPVCITRHIRSVSSDGIRWPMKPRLLFIAGPDTPRGEHQEALEQALAPWRHRTKIQIEGLACMSSPTLEQVAQRVAEAAAQGMPFSHVHVLAHGAALDPQDRYSPMGVRIHDDEAITGHRLATALTAVTADAVFRPAVVTLATCDSAAVMDVRSTDAGVAHELHDQGISLVVASQFPLSEAGSVPFVRHFYQGQLWGEHPLVSLFHVRLQLHSRMEVGTHDWASLVAYEAFPPDLDAQLDEFRYWQARRAHDGALSALERSFGQAADLAVGGTQATARVAWDQELAQVEASAARLPQAGPFALECAGLRASGHKRVAMAAVDLATRTVVDEAWRRQLLGFALDQLKQARTTYWRATKAFLGSWSEPGRRKANLHWLLGQVLSLDVVLGEPLDQARLAAARLAAETDLEGPGEADRAWAHVSLAELALLQLDRRDLDRAARQVLAAQCEGHVERVRQLVGEGSEHALTTARQFNRYVDCWGRLDRQAHLAGLGFPDRSHWHTDAAALVPTAARLVTLLGGKPADSSPEEATGAAPGGPSAEPAPASATPLAARPGAPPRHTGGRFSIEMLPAANGDCLWIEYGDPAHPHRVLIDCGAQSAARLLAERIRAVLRPGRQAFELFVLTHIDADHINGVQSLFDQADLRTQFGDIWFNDVQQMRRFLSVRQGRAFAATLADPALALPWNRAFTPAHQRHAEPVVTPAHGLRPPIDLPGGLRLTLLSPGPAQLDRMARNWSRELALLETPRRMLGRRAPPLPDPARLDLIELAKTPARKDTSAANGSSIALLAEFDGRAMLLTGDAHADVLTASIRALLDERGQAGQRLRLDALKLSHHGSANAMTRELLACVECPNYLVSTDGSIFAHPDREAIARVVVHGGTAPTLYFNHRSEQTLLWDDSTLRERHRYAAVYPQAGRAGLVVELA